MTYFWFDQCTAWLLAGMCWWIIHLTHDVKRSRGLILMQLGLALLGMTHMIIGTLRLQGVTFIAGGFSNAAIIVLLAGVILFHWQRFGRN